MQGSSQKLTKAATFKDPSPPSSLVKFDLKNDNFKFGTIGLYGTNRETAFYKIIANVGGKRMVVSKPDWPAITQTVWRVQPD